MKKPRFLTDDYARIPFSIIGVFLILGSSITVVSISRLELQKSQEIARSLNSHDLERLLNYAEADISTALNIAGMKGLKEIGKTPIIHAVVGTADEVNQYRVKEFIRAELNVYLTSHYLDNMFSDGTYAINVILYNETPLCSTDAISIETLPMQLKRITIPYIGPQETINHTCYWVASVPLDIEIRTMNDEGWEVLTTRTIVISSILTSRYPLLEELIKEYHQTINGTFSPLWTFTTIFSNLYSLVRGLKHYRCGNPLNVMDNRHLSVMVNSGLLLEQGLTFSSVDPLGLVELARNTKQVLKQTPQDALSTFNKEMEGDGYIVNTDNVSRGSANVDAGDPIETPVDNCPALNLSEIAERVLYNISSVTLQFQNTDGDTGQENIVFDDGFLENLNNAIQRWANESFFLTKAVKHLTINTTTQHVLEKITSEIYHDTIAIKIADRQVAGEHWGDPGAGWMSGEAGSWTPEHVVPLIKQVIKPPKGHITPGCALYQEEYNVSYSRTHSWWRMEERNMSGNITLVKVWNNVTDQQIETVLLQVILEQYAIYQGSQNDIVDVFYNNETVDDPNLEDTLETYLILYPDTHPAKQQMITLRDNQGTVGLEEVISGGYHDWVLEEAWNSLDETLGLMSEISLNSSINATQYPNPVLLIEMAKEDLETQYATHSNQFLNFSRYHPGTEFCSVGKKVVYSIQEWYVKTVNNTIETVFAALSEQLANAIDTAIPADAGFNANSINKALDDSSDAVRNQFTIPFGVDMTLTRIDDTGTIFWNETVRLAVDQYPNYLDPFQKTGYDGEELWTLKLRNRCTLGPTGLPILPPTPVTPWLLTMNVWVVDVEGEYAQLKIIDTSDETIFNPLLGHEPQVYIREAHIITVGNTTLGENTRLCFGFTTVAFGLVPPWGMMVGDIQENWFDDHTPGFEKEG
jgi:hypothetical protein